MSEYAEKGLESVADAVRLALDYFSLPKQEFIDKWLSDKKMELSRQTTPDSWRRIVESLRNRAQRAIVTDDHDGANVLVLAGPRFRQDQRPGAPHCVPDARQKRRSTFHLGAGVQPARCR